MGGLSHVLGSHVCAGQSFSTDSRMGDSQQIPLVHLEMDLTN